MYYTVDTTLVIICCTLKDQKESINAQTTCDNYPLGIVQKPFKRLVSCVRLTIANSFNSPLQTSVIIDEREFPGLGEVKRSPPPSKSKSATTAESSKANSEAGSVDADRQMESESKENTDANGKQQQQGNVPPATASSSSSSTSSSQQSKKKKKKSGE